MQILEMAAVHTAQIAALEGEIFSLPWDEPSIRAELSNPLSLWLVAAEGAGVLGYVGSQTCFEDTDILNVAVRPDRRRRGVAEALLRELEQRLYARGSRQITLEVRASNLPALALYGKLGYAEVGLRKGYYEKPREDARILQKQLVNT